MANRPSNRARNDWTLSLLELSPDARVLEIGFGPGYALSRLLTRIPEGRAIGIDHSTAMLTQARRRNAAGVAAHRLELHLGTLELLERWPDRFDAIYSANVFQFISDRPAAFRQILAALKPGGHVATTFQPRHPGATDADALHFGRSLIADLERAGLTAARLEHDPRSPVLTICALAQRPGP
ncbi:MAG: trans-aconitate 2-methyltransferase [Dehalococcoidia bacterium]